jgi:hypothetical protein
MNTRPRPIITEEQQAMLDGVQVRLIESGEREPFDQLMIQEHYLGNAQLVGAIALRCRVSGPMGRADILRRLTN